MLKLSIDFGCFCMLSVLSEFSQSRGQIAQGKHAGKGLFTPALAVLALDEIAALCLPHWSTCVAFVQRR